MLRLITDFDGPIMDVSDRYYRVYQRCLHLVKSPQQPINVLSQSQFWRLKRSRVPERKIGLLSGLSPEQAQIFTHLRRTNVHALPYLVYDTVVPGAIFALEQTQQLGFELVLMTMRKEKELDLALKQNNLARFFPPHLRYCFQDDYLITLDTKDKPLLMAKIVRELPTAADVWMIGDTEADVIAAKSHNIKVISVLSGIRDRQQLELYQPNLIVDNLAQAVNYIYTSLSL
jgi:phosphoglycolate phosphatase-like HAD superfamily hydrolase